MRLIITGTPGVGKHTLSRMLASNLNAKVIDVNDLVFKHEAISGIEDGTAIADIDKIREIIKDQVDDNCIVVGHLAQDVVDEIDYAIVLRRSPYELEQVYASRGYDAKKSKDNLVSEILAVITYECINKFGKDKIIEVDCTKKKPEDIVKEIMMYINNNKSVIGIDWLSLVAMRNDMNRFFGE